MPRAVIDAILVLFGVTLMAGAMSVGGPAIDEYDALRDAQEAAAKRERFERGAQASCGENAAWVELPDGQTQCKTKHGRNTIMAKMVDAFAPFGVTKEQIEKRIQRRLDSIQPAQVVMLKRIYASLRDDMSTVADWFDVVEPGAAPAPAPEPKAAPPGLSDEDFAKKLKAWGAAVEGGKSAADVIAMASTRNTLTEAQKTAIQAFAQKPANPQE